MKSLRERAQRCVVITDETVADLYGERLETALKRQQWTPRIITVPAGEESKSGERLSLLHDEILAWGIDRQVPVLALGGGVIGDLAGFAAATLLRGLPLIQIPTTLIAQVDSSIGGKTGINHPVGKNLIGAFHQPRFIATDPALLQSLPDREWFSGMAEVVKHALIADAALAEWLDDRWDKVAVRDEPTVHEMVRRAATVKVRIVEEDVMEHGQRALLNFGHTFGHAIERTAGYGAFTHGEAVAVGMKAALHLSARRHPQVDFSLAERLVSRIPITGDLDALSTAHLIQAMRFDKKSEAGSLRLVALRCVGAAEIVRGPDPALVEEAWSYAKSA